MREWTLGIYSHFVARRNESGLGARLEAFLAAERHGPEMVPAANDRAESKRLTA